jgi:hypothetical protein
MVVHDQVETLLAAGYEVQANLGLALFFEGRAAEALPEVLKAPQRK